MAYIKNRIIHRFIRDIREYLEGGICFAQILPPDTQVYAFYPKEAQQVDDDGNPKIGLYYAIGDGVHTYTEIRSGYGEQAYHREYYVLPGESTIFDRVKITDLKDGNLLRYDAQTDYWVNINGPELSWADLVEETEFICGKALTEIIDFLDGGHAGTRFINYLNCGRVSDVNYNIEFIQWI